MEETNDGNKVFCLVSRKEKDGKTVISQSKTKITAFFLVEKKLKKSENYVAFMKKGSKNNIYVYGELETIRSYLQTSKIPSFSAVLDATKITLENYTDNQDFMDMYNESKPEKQTKESREELMKRANTIIALFAQEKKDNLKKKTLESGRVIKSPKKSDKQADRDD